MNATKTTNRVQDLPDWNDYVVDREDLRLALLRGLRDHAEQIQGDLTLVRKVLHSDPTAPAALASLHATLGHIRELQAGLMGWD